MTEPHAEVDDAPRGGPIAWMARNRVASNVLMLVLMIGGVLSLSRIKQEVFPEIELDMILVNVPYPGASPEEVEQGVVLAVEEAVRGLDGVKEVRGTATEGVGVVAIDLLLGTDPDRALSDVKSAVDRVTSFPLDAERPVVSIASNRQQTVSVVMHGPVEERVLHELSERLRQRLLEDERITYVDFTGVRPLEIGIEIPRERLREHGLTVDRVAQTIRQASIELPAGTVKTRRGEVLLRTAERRDRGDEFGEIVLLSRPDGSSVRVRDIAEIDDGFSEVDQEARFGDEPAVLINVYRTGDQGPIDVSDAVYSVLEQIRPALPEGVRVQVWNDWSEAYRDRIDLLRRNALLGLVLVLIILGMFLEGRLAFWVTLGIPISFAGSLLFLQGTSVSINMISLFAFIVTLGMVVDDAIIIGEAVYRQRELGHGRLRAAIVGAKEVATPVTFSIMTTCVAFAPLLFVPGMMGKFFSVIPTVVICVLLISLFESLFVLPAHLSHEMPWWLRLLLWPFLIVLKYALQPRHVARGLGWLIRRTYEPTVRFAVRWRYLTAAGCLALLLVSFGLVAGGRIQRTFMPKIDGDVITATLEMPVGTPIEETRVHSEHMRRAIRELLAEHRTPEGEPITRGVFSTIGATNNSGGGPRAGPSRSGSHLTTVSTYLVQADQRSVTSAALAQRWRERVGEIAGAESLSFRFNIGGTGQAPIDIELAHPDAGTLEAAAARLARELASYDGAKDIDDGYAEGKEQVDLRLRPEARALGLTETDLARQVRGSFFGAEALRQQRGRDEVRVFVRLPDSQRRSLHDLEALMLRTPSGGEIPLGQAATVSIGHAYTQIQRTDGRRTVHVTADVAEGEGNANEIVAGLARTELPALVADVPGLAWELGGDQQEQADSMRALLLGFVTALIVMFALLAIVFRSYVQPIIVLLAIPFGFVGAIAGHFLMGYEMSFMTMFGIVALSGVVVNDSLVLVDAINRYRQEHSDLLEAIVAGGVRRFRPILLTSLTTFFGLFPMILETSVQARFLIPMAISLGFGVLFATFFTLVLVPAAYLIVEDAKRASRWLVDLYRAPADATAPPAGADPLPGQ